VYKFMGEHVNQERQEPEVSVSIQSLQNPVILKADEVEITIPGTRFNPLLFFVALLKKRKNVSYYFIGSQLRKRFDIVAVPSPLP